MLRSSLASVLFVALSACGDPEPARAPDTQSPQAKKPQAQVPQAKTPQMFSLATPIEVSGPFEDFSIRASPGEVIGTATKFLTSIFWVPIKKLSGNKIPADGADVCNVSLQTLPESNQ